MININEQINSWIYSYFCYGSSKEKRILVIKGCDEDFDTKVFKDTELVFTDDIAKSCGEKYDVVISVELPEKKKAPSEYIESCCRLLKENGKMLFPMNNRIGIRYFCGDRDPYTDRVFDGVENYCNDPDTNSGRCFTQNEMRNLINEAGYHSIEFYGIYSGIDYPTHIVAKDFDINEDWANRILPVYHYPGTVFLEEERIYDTLKRERLVHSMANGYLVEITNGDGGKGDILAATLSLGRARGNAYVTVIHRDDRVTKTALYKEGQSGLEHMMDNHQLLKQRGINMVPLKRECGDSISMPCIHAQTAQCLLQDLLKRDKTEFLKMLDLFMEEIDRSCDVIGNDPELGPIANIAFPDMVPVNAFSTEKGFLFFDQEFALKEYPVNAIKARVLSNLFAYHDELRFAEMELYQRYGLAENRQVFQKIENEFLHTLWSEDELKEFRDRKRRNTPMTLKNRAYMNEPAGSYEVRYTDILRNANEKTCYVFGAGKYAAHFINKYRNILDIENVIDNDPDKWGKQYFGFEIVSPEILRHTDDNVRVFICIKNCLAIIKQLDALRVPDYCVYDMYAVYPLTNTWLNDSGKPYHIGYVAGAFDIFHIGHLNLLQRAKAKCDYLIAGVMSDERIYELKNKHPVIPCHERMRIVEGCRYVDEVIELPVGKASIRDAYERVHFDCMFSGDDHKDDPGWLSEKEYLNSVGSDILFLTYTRETSSTMIRERAAEPHCLFQETGLRVQGSTQHPKTASQ